MFDPKTSAYEVIRSSRKTVAVEVTRDARVRVRAPHRLPRRELEQVLVRYAAWIDAHVASQQARAAAFPEPTPQEEAALRAKAAACLPGRVAHYAALMGVTPTSLKITSARTRFGSCSGKNGLCFSFRLMAYPEAAIDYVVVHELAHITHKNHSAAFYAHVAAYMPDWQARRALLRR